MAFREKEENSEKPGEYGENISGEQHPMKVRRCDSINATEVYHANSLANF